MSATNLFNAFGCGTTVYGGKKQSSGKSIKIPPSWTISRFPPDFETSAGIPFIIASARTLDPLSHQRLGLMTTLLFAYICFISGVLLMMFMFLRLCFSCPKMFFDTTFTAVFQSPRDSTTSI